MEETRLQKLTSKDKRLLWIAVGIAIISGVIAWIYFDDAFPEANIRFDVDRDASQTIAGQFLHSQGLEISPYRHASMFDYDTQAKVYLEREVGLEEANQLMGDAVKIWHWSHRWYQSKQKEEYQVDVTPQGAVSRFQRIIPEEAEGAILSGTEAEVLAREFVIEGMNRSLEPFTLIEHSAENLPNRTDHTFTWERTDLLDTDATYRYEVVIQGEQFGGFREYLKVPEAWSRDYQEMRSANSTTGIVDSFFLLLTMVAMLIILIQKSRHGDVRWKTAFIFGVIGAVLMLGSQLNSLPLTLYQYSTTDAYGDFITQQILLALLQALLAGGGIFALTAAAEPLYRERYGEKLSLSRAFTPKGIQTKRFFIAVVVGLVMTCFFMAYQTVFYLISSKFGAWAPADVPYSDLLNTAVPWIFVLLMGFFPAVSEEFMSRMFSIPFLEKYLNVRWLAIVIPALIWGFGHAGYPNQPFYIRGLEVGIAGIFIGVLMLRFGIIATLIWHYTVDALYTAFLLFRSGDTYYIISGGISAGIMLVPLIVAVVLYMKNGGFRPADECINQAEGVASPQPKSPPQPLRIIYEQLSLRRIVIGSLAAVAVGCAVLLPGENPADFVNVKLTKGEIRQKADTWLAQQTDSVDAYIAAITIQETGQSRNMKYLLEHTTVDSTRRILREFLYPSVWNVRYYKPLEKKEYHIQYNPDTGDMVAFRQRLPEAAPGDSLNQEAAVDSAVNYLIASGIDTTNYALRTVEQVARPNRLDYNMTFEGKETFWPSIDDGKPLLQMEIHGNTIGRFARGYHLPEEWTRTRTAQTLGRTVRNIGRIVVFLIFGISGLVLFIRRIRQEDSFTWKTPLIVGAVGSVLGLLLSVNNWNTILSGYITTIPWSQFQTIMIVYLVIGGLGVGGLLLLGTALNRLYFPGSLMAWKAPERYRFSRDALIIVPMAILGFLGIEHLQTWLRLQFPNIAIFPIDGLPGVLDTYLPAFSVVGSAVIRGAIYAIALGLFAILWTRYFMHWALKVLVVILVLLTLVPPNTLTTAEWALQAGISALPLLWWGIVWVFFLRNNYLGYIMIPIGVVGLAGGLDLYNQNSQPYIIQGMVVFVVFVLLWFWTLADAFRHRDAIRTFESAEPLDSQEDTRKPGDDE